MPGGAPHPDRPGPRHQAWTIRTAMIAISALALLLAPVPVARSRWPQQGLWWAIYAFPEVYGGLATGLALAAAVGASVRCVRSGLAPRPAEWLALIVALQAADRFLLTNGPFSMALLSLNGVTFEVAGYIFRVTTSSLGMLVTAACLALLHARRRSLRVWSKILLLGVLALALLWGPWREGLYLGAMSLGLREGPSTSWLWSGPALWLEWLPFTAAVAATWLDLRSRDRPRWRLTESAGLVSALLVMASGAVSALQNLLVLGPKALPASLYGPAAFLAWWVAVFVLCCILVRRLGPSWTRWLSPPEVAREPASASESPPGASVAGPARMEG